jgi:hypothetical protein
MKNITIEEIKNTFLFLEIDYAFKIIKESNSEYALNIIYRNDTNQIRLGYDYRDNIFYFLLIRGAQTRYPNDSDRENIRDFFSIVEKYSIPDITESDLQPTENDYSAALKLNAELLHKYGERILQGKEWF